MSFLSFLRADILISDENDDINKENIKPKLDNYPYNERLILDNRRFVIVTNETENKIRIGLEKNIDNENPNFDKV